MADPATLTAAKSILKNTLIYKNNTLLVSTTTTWRNTNSVPFKEEYLFFILGEYL
jgi:hypothetical protein